MGKFTLTDCRIFAGAADLTGNSNKIDLGGEVSDEDTTNFGGKGWKEVIGGLASAEVSGEGQWEAGDASKVDDSRWSALGGNGPWTVCPTDALVGALAYFTNAMSSKYVFGGEVGAVAPWQAEAKSTWPLVRGLIAHPPGTARTASGTGAGQQLGAVPAGKNLYAAAHVLSVAGTAGPTITLAVESDDANTFASATTVATFAAANAPGAQILRVPGPITDNWFRPKWTITGTAPSFLFVVALGIF